MGVGGTSAYQIKGVLSVSKFQVFRSRDQLMPGAYKVPFWCGKDRPAGPNTDMPANPVQTEVLGSAWGDTCGAAQVRRYSFWLRAVYSVGNHGGSEAADIMEKVLLNRRSTPNRNPEVCTFLYILMIVFQGEVQANSISAFEP